MLLYGARLASAHPSRLQEFMTSCPTPVLTQPCFGDVLRVTTEEPVCERLPGRHAVLSSAFCLTIRGLRGLADGECGRSLAMSFSAAAIICWCISISACISLMT